MPLADVRRVAFAGPPALAAIFHGEPPPGATIAGPAICALPDATLLVAPGWAGAVDAYGTIHLHDRRDA
jgi:N-methylhydantoinase A/oxoprolinase/acetone carboxylase beta subunit